MWRCRFVSLLTNYHHVHLLSICFNRLISVLLPVSPLFFLAILFSVSLPGALIYLLAIRQKA